MSETYAALRAELRGFYPDHSHAECKSPEQVASVKGIMDAVRAYAAEHPDYDALELRRVSYAEMRRQFVPFLFDESPFYFEAGINGGWAGIKPGTVVKSLCSKFFESDIPEEARKHFGNRNRQRYTLCCGYFTDEIHHLPPLDTILREGFSGVYARTKAALAECETAEERRFIETALDGLETVHALQLTFVDAARKRLAENPPIQVRERLERIVESASRCPWEPPRTFYEGLNTLWFVREILSYVDGLAIYALGRVDFALLDLYENDLKAERLTKEEAYDLICRFLLVAECHYDGMWTVEGYSEHELEIPITLGGCDAQGNPVYNDLTKMCLDAHWKLALVFPKLHCRISSTSPTDYLERIAKSIIDGHNVYALMNDERTIPLIQGYGVPLERARCYYASGCWNGHADSCEETDTANYFSMARVLEATIHVNEDEEREVGVRFDRLDNASSFEELVQIYLGNAIQLFVKVMSDYSKYGGVSTKVCPHPTYSVCLDGCLETKRDVTAGGCLYKPRVMTLAFLANVVDSLCSINQVCFVDKACTVPEFLDAVRSNWEGHEALRQHAMRAPYWGDHSDITTDLMRRIIDDMHAKTLEIKNDRGGPFILAAWIYREFKFWGEKTKATPDGRRDGAYLAQGLCPSDFRNRSDITTVINSLGDIRNEHLSGGSNFNVSFCRKSISVDALVAIFRTVAAKGIHLLQPNCFDRETLLDAQQHPELYPNLMIKVCGFSARFVALSKSWQDEIIGRWLY